MSDRDIIKNIVKRVIEESNTNEARIHPSEAYNNEDALRTLVNGTRNVALVMLHPSTPQVMSMLSDHPDIKALWVTPPRSAIRQEYIEEFKNKGMAEYYADNNFIYFRDNKDGRYRAKKLFDFMKSHQGFVSDESPGDAALIGTILNYDKNSIRQYIEKQPYSKKRDEENIDEAEKKKADRCLRIARRKYDKPSAYRSGAIVKCRQGKIWKDLKEEDGELNEDESLHKWFSRRGEPGKGGGWVDCNTCRTVDGKKKCKACGRQKGEKRSKYPSCRPTPSKCKDPGKGKKWGKTKENYESLKKFISEIIKENNIYKKN